jgi:ABC-type nitrate/sulfonate/bicarbonate transport system substrate-binding protein
MKYTYHENGIARRPRAGLLCAALLLAAAPAMAKQITIGVREFLSDVPEVVADSAGYYSAEGLDVRTVVGRQGRDAAAMLLDGTVDAAVVGGHMGVDLSGKAAKDDPFVVAACLGGGGRRWRVMAADGSGISSLEGLRGRKIGAWPSSYGWHLLERVLKAKKIPVRMVKVPMDPGSAVEAFSSEKLDAVLAWEPVPAMLEEKKLAHGVFDLDGLGSGVPVYLVVRKSFAEGRAAELTALLRALARAAAYTRENPGKAAAMAAGAMRTAPELIAASLGRHEFGLGLTCGQRAALADALRVFREGKRNKVPAGTAVGFAPEALKAALAGLPGEKITVDENCR